MNRQGTLRGGYVPRDLVCSHLTQIRAENPQQQNMSLNPEHFKQQRLFKMLRTISVLPWRGRTVNCADFFYSAKVGKLKKDIQTSQLF